MDFTVISVTLILIIFLFISYLLKVIKLSTPLLLIYLIFCFTYLIDNNANSHLSGTAIASTFEGQKTFLVEVQSLVTPAVYGTPQRSCNGFNLKRLNMLLAVLEKKCGFKLSSQDVFLNIAGGINVSDPSMDLAVIASILSSNEEISINSKMCFSRLNISFD